MDRVLLLGAEMIRFEATLELMLCMIGALLSALLVGWLCGNDFFIGLAVGLGVFCFSVDCLFSYEVEYEDDEDL
jgi:hypothetical protein